jgi:hypothetical protein
MDKAQCKELFKLLETNIFDGMMSRITEGLRFHILMGSTCDFHHTEYWVENSNKFRDMITKKMLDLNLIGFVETYTYPWPFSYFNCHMLCIIISAKNWTE